MKNVFTILFTCVLSLQFAMAQGITTYQYRRVAPADMDDYLKRETTYWKTWAEAEVKKGNLLFWAILQRIGGMNQENGSNILIINTFKDIDKGADWGSVDAMFPNVKMEDIQTWDISTNRASVFLRGLNHIQGENVDPPKDFNFVRIIYHNTKNNGMHLAFESDKWKPMVEKAMADGKTTMKGWGNSQIISPESDDFPYSTISYDLFSSLHDALSPAFSEDMTIPDGFFDGLNENYEGPRNSNVFRVVTVVTPEWSK
ncbi:hypothetical protein [Muriicola sp. Z0-33]|uniref:hypothetical protein n=1 Tax=Muriicola sp. Z0-33 TaxID=2816957 RepID=UPI00223910C6|nr:hypothetical protein [Muriicola sp. Z0-33]MCW5515416.1 hypothetical protein [Muriicola sp. Z0-33]